MTTRQSSFTHGCLSAFLFAMLTIFHITTAYAIGDFGPATCSEGYVWREACGPDDKVCVLPKVREQAQRDNRDAPNRISAVKTYGPDTCKQGYVWREACGQRDHVCVPLQTRGEAEIDNKYASTRLKYADCNNYAKDAVNAAHLGELYRCGFGGNRWTQDEKAHFYFCMNATSAAVAGQREARYRILGSCNTRAGETARAGKSYPGGTSGGGTGKCCISPGGIGPDGRQVPGGYTCGPQCP